VPIFSNIKWFMCHLLLVLLARYTYILTYLILCSLLFQVEGAFVQGIGYFMNEEYVTNSDGLLVSDGTWTYKIPTVDTIPKQFNVKLLNSGFHKKRVLSSKGILLQSIHKFGYVLTQKFGILVSHYLYN
jgi:hypothetical protein